MKNAKTLQWSVLAVLTITFLALAISYSQNNAVADTPKTTSSQNPVDDPDISTYMKAIQAVGLGDLFKGTGPFTGFIPSNKAFDKFGKDKLNKLMNPENQDRLTDLLIYHIVPGKYLAGNLNTRNYKTINGRNIDVTVENGVIRVNNATVIRTDMVGPNGVIHEIDTVLEP
jgi:uncharacterized surface protein with fasciclin (FAS1) repeats